MARVPQEVEVPKFHTEKAKASCVLALPPSHNKSEKKKKKKKKKKHPSRIRFSSMGESIERREVGVIMIDTLALTEPPRRVSP